MLTHHDRSEEGIIPNRWYGVSGKDYDMLYRLARFASPQTQLPLKLTFAENPVLTRAVQYFLRASG